MKPIPLLPLLTLLLAVDLPGADSSVRQANTVVLDAIGVENLRIQTAIAETGDFEETVFALGRIEAKPGNVAAVASRISGRVVELTALPGDTVEAKTVVVKIESRQPGNPPPVVALQSPIYGTVTRLDVRLGDPVEPDRALLEIADLREVIAVARVPEYAAGRIEADAVAHIRLSAWPDRILEGKLLRFGTSADSVGGTLDAVFVLPNPEGRIRPGMRAEFSIVVEKRTDVMSVPRSALQGEPAGRFVYVKDFELPNAFVKAPVVVGQTNDRFVEIVSGLFPADEVVTQGAYSLAFAGGGTLSLKEALDAAHGHAHAADGSEMSSDPKAKTEKATNGDGHDDAHTHAHGSAGSDLASRPHVWMIVSAVLFVLLVIVSFRKRRAPVAPAETAGRSER